MKIRKVLFLAIILMFLYPVVVNADTPEITATSAVVIDCLDGKMVYTKNMDEKLYPASLTKILTAAIVIEKCNLTDEVEMSASAIRSVPEGYVTSNIKEGEILTVEQLLNLLLISSCNDVANVLAEHIGGSIDGFTDIMNEKASEIGCTNSHFTNCNGAHDENHYSTAHDLALIGKYAMQFDEIKEIVKKTYYELGPTNKYEKDDRIYTTTNEMILSGSSNYYKYAAGVKTGFTTPAGNCLMVYAVKYDIPFVAVVLKSTTSDSRYDDARKILEDSFSKYTLKTIATIGTNVQTLNIKRATSDTKKLNAVLEKSVVAVVKDENKDVVVEPKVSINPKLKAPIKKGEVIGTASYEFEGIKYTVNVLAESDVERSYIVLKFILTFVGIILLFGSLRVYRII